MSLRRRILIYVGVTTLCMLSLLYLISESALLHNYEQMELDSLRENMKQNLLSYFDEYTNLGAIAINYAGWDDTYSFIDRPMIPRITTLISRSILPILYLYQVVLILPF